MHSLLFIDAGKNVETWGREAKAGSLSRVVPPLGRLSWNVKTTRAAKAAAS